MSPIDYVAYWIHPVTGETAVFDDLAILKQTIIEWYELIEQHDLWSEIPHDRITFCINTTERYGEQLVHSSKRVSINLDGTIFSMHMDRLEDGHFDPSISNIVIPETMFLEYESRYSI
jgi:hypothetical protein